jgi:tetratricopeptide (TPR) repeat protein
MEGQIVKDADAKLASGKPREAIAYCDFAISRNPKNYRAYFHRGDAYLALKKVERAKDDFHKVLQIKPGYQIEDEKIERIRVLMLQKEEEKDRELKDKNTEEDPKASVPPLSPMPEPTVPSRSPSPGKKRTTNRSLGKISPEFTRTKRSPPVSAHDLQPVEKRVHLTEPEDHDVATRSRSPSLPDMATLPSLISPSAIDSATKERASYLFDSSPSTRAPHDPPLVHGKLRSGDVDIDFDEAVTPVKRPRAPKDSLVSPESKYERASKEFGSPTKQQKPPYQLRSIFGGSSERRADKPVSSPTPSAKHGQTPTAPLDSIKEFSSPDDSPLHRKGRDVSDVGAPDRGVKRTTGRRSISEQKPADRAVTPTPSSRRKLVEPLSDLQAQDAQAKDSPWHQVHEGGDRDMTLSLARRLRHSASITDPIKQRLGEQRSPSVSSDRLSGSGITRHRTPDHLRPLSATSSRSATPPLRRVDRSASGDLRAAAKLGEASAQDRQISHPSTSDIALAASASAAVVAGIVSSSKDESIRGKGKPRAVPSMPDVYVSVTPLGDVVLSRLLTYLVGGMG